MKTSVRFENAITKLYKAYHENRLDAWDCTACAVGNICNNKEDWAMVRGGIYNSELLPIEDIPKKAFKIIKKSGYSPLEIVEIERRFVFSQVKSRSEYIGLSGEDLKSSHFKGLCAVVEYLCELDGIPNIMDYQSLFETEADKPKHELSEIFAL